MFYQKAKILKIVNVTVLIASMLLFIACSKNNMNEYNSDVNFHINDQEIESLGVDYDEEELSLYKNDPDKIYFTTIGDKITLEDVSTPHLSGERRWFLDSDELKEQQIIALDKSKFQYVFDTPGIYKISLKRGEDGGVTKFIRVIDKNSHSVTVNNGDELVDLGVTGDIGYFEVFDFKVSNAKPSKWEAIVLEDVSKTENEIDQRLWDFGDGTIIPTKGRKVKYSYATAGVYEVKLCVNMTNNCKRKRIIVTEVNENSPSIIAKQLDFDDRNSGLSKADMSGPKNFTYGKSESERNVKKDNFNTPSREIESAKRKVELVLQNVGFEMPETIKAGLPVRIKDQSFPDEAIRSRSWFIDGEKQFFHQRTVNYIFDLPGTYEIKMCLNKKADQCIVKNINVYQNSISEDVKVDVAVVDKPIEKKNDIKYVPIISKPSEGFMCQSYGKAGLKSKYKCTTSKEYHYGNAIVTITPNKKLELQNAEIYGEIDGYMDVFLLDDGFVELGRIKNVQVLPGYSTIEFADLAFTLEEGKTYSVLLKPKNSEGKKIGLENASTCKVPIYQNADMTVDYQGKAFVMYDIKYCL